MDSMIQIENLRKDFPSHLGFKKKRALVDLTFSVNENEVLGIVGHNGAGKTTLFKILLNLMKPDEGTVSYNPQLGTDPRRRIGFLPESPYFYDYLTAAEALHFYGKLFSISLAEREIIIPSLLEKVGIHKEKNIRLKNFSKGMLQRFGLAQALVNDPELIILDEPMSGLDPLGRRDIMQIIQQYHCSGKSIVFSSHILSDIEEICDRVVVLEEGKIVKIISKNEIQDIQSWSLKFDGNNALQEVSRRWNIHSNQTSKGVSTLIVSGENDEVNDIVRVILEKGGTLLELRKKVTKLESLFGMRRNN